MKVLVIVEKDSDFDAVLLDRPVPEIEDDEILVKVGAVCLNPTDWKHVTYKMGKVGSICGCDFAGMVVKTGKSVTTPKVGDRVSGVTHGGTYPDLGSFAEYLRTPAELVWRTPASMSDAEASTLNVAAWTVIQAFYHPKRLGFPEPPAKVPEGQWMFIYGGSSAVGLCAIPLARHSGFKVATAASPKNHALLKALGADAVFDYHDPAVVDQILAATGGGVQYALDTITDETTSKITQRCFAPGGGTMVTLLFADEKWKMREDVVIMSTILYTVNGREFSWEHVFPGLKFPAAPEDREHMASFMDKIPVLIEQGVLKPLPMRVSEGLDALPGVMDAMRSGKYSAEKFVGSV